MSAVQEVSQSTFQAEVLGSDKPVLVDFWAPWCGPCRAISPIVEKLAGTHGEHVKFMKLNTDDNQELASRYHILGIPCLVLFKNGQPVDRIEGVSPRPERDITSMLDKHRAAA